MISCSPYPLNPWCIRWRHQGDWVVYLVLPAMSWILFELICKGQEIRPRKQWYEPRQCSSDIVTYLCWDTQCSPSSHQLIRPVKFEPTLRLRSILQAGIQPTELRYFSPGPAPWVSVFSNRLRLILWLIAISTNSQQIRGPVWENEIFEVWQGAS